MRTVREIESEIVDAEARVRELRAEWRQAQAGRIEIICREFVEGSTFAEIATRHRITVHAVAGIVYRNGHSIAGRRALRLRGVVQRHGGGQAQAASGADSRSGDSRAFERQAAHHEAVS